MGLSRGRCLEKVSTTFAHSLVLMRIQLWVPAEWMHRIALQVIDTITLRVWKHECGTAYVANAVGLDYQITIWIISHGQRRIRSLRPDAASLLQAVQTHSCPIRTDNCGSITPRRRPRLHFVACFVPTPRVHCHLSQDVLSPRFYSYAAMPPPFTTRHIKAQRPRKRRSRLAKGLRARPSWFFTGEIEFNFHRRSSKNTRRTYLRCYGGVCTEV
jgi:hypothetical protein